jgi:hypothetical protein
VGHKAIWNGDRFLFTLAPRRALRQSKQQTMTPEGNLERREVSIYLGTPSCIASGQAADKQDRKEKAMGQKEKERKRNLERRLFCIYLGAPSCIAPEQTADDHEDEQEEADA